MPHETGPGPQADRRHLGDFDAVEAHSLLELEPPAHTRIRGLVNRAFVSRQVERLRPRSEEIAHELIDGFEKDGGADLISAYAAPLPVTIISELLGVPIEMGPQLLQWSHDMVRMYVAGAARAAEIRANNSAREFAAFLKSHVESRRAAPGEDLLSHLIAATEDGERLSEDELVSSVILLLNAGHEATVHQTGNAVLALLAQDGDKRRFFETPADVARTVEECLRFDAPLHMFTRHAYETVTIDGITIDAGEQIGLLLGAANRDPRAFDRPHRFWPERPDQKLVSFGAGIHFCIGAPLARLELQASLRILFERLPDLHLSGEATFQDNYHFRGLERLPIAWQANNAGS